MLVSTTSARRGRKLLGLAMGATVLSLRIGAFAGQRRNNAAVYDSLPAAVPATSAGSVIFVPNPDLSLEVNLSSGDVYLQAAVATTLTGYDFLDRSNNLLDSGDPNTDLNERLLSQPASSLLGNKTTFRNSTNYKLWSIIKDNESGLGETLNNGRFKDGTPSTYDTINIPATGTIDFGDIYNRVANVQDYFFQYTDSGPNGDPNTSPVYFVVPIYIGGSTLAPSSYWKDTASGGSFSSGGNWSSVSPGGADNAGTPPPGNFVYLANTDSENRVIVLDQNSTPAMLEIGNTGGGSDVLNQSADFSLSTRIEKVGAANNSIGGHIQSAGTNTYSQALIVGSGTGSIGTYSLSGSGAVTVNATQAGPTGLLVGSSASGTFDQSGGSVAVNDPTFGSLYVGFTSSGAGTYLLSGSSSLNVASSEYVGYGGAGTFNQSGGSNTVTGGLNDSRAGLYVGYAATGTYFLSGGTLTVDGNATLLNDVIGYTAAGTFNQSGGVHADSSYLIIGEQGPGTYLMSGGTLSVNSAFEMVGLENSGTFIQSGGDNSTIDLQIGCAGASSPLVSSGSYLLTGGTLSISGGELVGFGRQATFTQTGGVNYIGNSEDGAALYIQPSPAQPASYSLSGTGSLTVDGNVYVGGTSSAASSGNGTFAISGGAMSVSNMITVYSGSNFTQSGGTVSAGSMTINSGGTLNFSGGTLSAQVTVAGALTTSPSQNSINLIGSLTLQSTATTLAQCTGTAATFATVNDNGNMTLAGVLALYEDAANESSTTADQSFIILQTTSGGVLSGVFSNISSGQTLTTTDGSASFLVTINEGVNGDVVLSDFQYAPEPGMLGLFGIVGIMIMRRKRAPSPP